MKDAIAWILWTVAFVFVGLVWFAYLEIKRFREGRGTLSDVTERAIRWSRPLWWALLVAMIVLCIGWPLLVVHWYTSLW